jgi:hypothetical protein
MKIPLNNVIPFEISPRVLQEVRENVSGPVTVEGILQKANEQNQNGRRYPKPILEREIMNYQKNFVNERRALGELDHPNSGVINLKNVSHNIVECHWEGDNVVGTIEILTTPAGNILRELIKNNIRLGISSRGMGSVKELREGGVEVQDDFELLCFDFVSNPSTRGAFMQPQSLNEGLEKTLEAVSKYGKVEGLIYDLLSEMK